MKFLNIVLCIFSALITYCNVAISANLDLNLCDSRLKEVLEYKIKFTKFKQNDDQSVSFDGLNSEGIKELKKLRDTLRQRRQVVTNEIRGYESLYHVGELARLNQEHILIMGPPGGAKSMFVNILLNSEAEEPFSVQMDQMKPAMLFKGGIDFEQAKLGKTVYSPEGSLADFTTAKIDEIDKANPSALAPILEIMEEKVLRLMNNVYPAKTETIIATSNANLPELYKIFEDNNEGSTIKALLNRFSFKSFVYNWLSPENQKYLDLRRERRSLLKVAAKQHPEALKDEVFMTPETVNWNKMRALIDDLVILDDTFTMKLNEFLEGFREDLISEMFKSSKNFKSKREEEVFKYVSSAYFSERFRQKFTKIIKTSFFIDFLQSPLADDVSIESIIKKPIKLDLLSLWRANYLSTTIGPGDSSLKLVKVDGGESKFEVDFGWNIDPSSARDIREQKMITNLQLEQEIFNRHFHRHISDWVKTIEPATILFGPGDYDDLDQFGEKSFEVLLMQFKKGPR